MDAARAFIAERFPIQSLADVPEVRLHLAGPRSGLSELAERVGAHFRTPYWAFEWAGGVALARYILDDPDSVRGRRILDVGTGGGLVGIAAALAGASHVEAIDIDPLAIVAADLNAAANRVALRAKVADVMAVTAIDADVVCAGDLFYSPEVADASLAFAERCRAAGARVLLGDPWRRDLPVGRMRMLRRYAVRDFAEGTRATAAAVFTLAA